MRFPFISSFRSDGNSLDSLDSVASLPGDNISLEDTKSVDVTAEHELKTVSRFDELIEEHETEYTVETDEKPYLENTKRRLKNRHIQLIGIGGTIGTALFVAIGGALTKGGPASLFLGFALWCIPVLCITVCTAEMVTLYPFSSPFIRLAGRCCDEAFEVMAGWNFFFLEAALIPFEITAVNTIIHFWVTGYSPAITLSVQMVMYMAINVFAVALYGESEFWLAIGKVILAVGLMFFTFIVMVGGNPQHDAFGFRYWNNPGAFAEYISTGGWGRFLGLFACLIQACFTVAGPEYVSMAAGETENPRKTLPKAFKAVFFRLTFFFIGGALCVGILVPYNDTMLRRALDANLPGAGSSPYVIAMQQLGIGVLPDIVNALILTACFSAGNSYTYCASRTLYGLSLNGHAPKFLQKCTGNGVPIYCVVAALCFGLLSFLQLGKSASVVLNWIINLVTASQLINFCVLCTTYICFFNALKKQGIDRRSLPFRGWYQPYTAYFGLFCAFCMTFLSGYYVFLPGWWSVPTFLFSYLMIFIDIFIFVLWKFVIGRTSWKKPGEIDLKSGLKEIDQYETYYYEQKGMTPQEETEMERNRPWYRKFFHVFFF